MDLAVKEHLTEHNPCRDVEVSRPRSAERTPLTLEEAISLCQALHGDELDGKRVTIWLALAGGVRRGEALGLTWRYVDFDNMRVFIKHQYTENKALRETKNRRSRWIAIDDGTARYLRTWKAAQVRRMQVQGLSQTPNTPMCPDGDFGFHDPDNFSTWQRGYLIEHGLGRMEEAEEGGRKRRRYVGYDGSRRPRPPISWRSSAGRARPSPSTGAGSPSWRGRLGADVATTKHTPSLTSEVIAAGPAGDKAQDDKMLSTQERPHL